MARRTQARFTRIRSATSSMVRNGREIMAMVKIMARPVQSQELSTKTPRSDFPCYFPGTGKPRMRPHSTLSAQCWRDPTVDEERARITSWLVSSCERTEHIAGDSAHAPRCQRKVKLG